MNPVNGRSSKAAFTLLWRINGGPYLKVIKPVTAWKLPTGVTYDARRDQFLDTQEDAVEINWRTQPYLSLPFLPPKETVEVAFAVPGVASGGSVSVLLLWSSKSESAFKDAWGVSIGDVLYRVESHELFPKGVSSPLTIRVELEESQSTR